MKHLRYLRYLLRHKWFVFLECLHYRNLHMLWLGLTHDISKLLPDEWLPYANYFYSKSGHYKSALRDKTGYYRPVNTGDTAFDYAWRLHSCRNKHHWQWWVIPDIDGNQARPMKHWYIREMIADWRGAARAQGSKDCTGISWYLNNQDKMLLHPYTKAAVEVILGLYDKANN